jgi:hypothetical protein
MPPLTPEVNAIIRELSEPLEPGLRPAFQQAVEQKLAPSAGPGTAHQVGRMVQRDFRDPPDLRRGRVVLKT